MKSEKQCKFCGKAFKRAKWRNDKSWELQTVCSQECSIKLNKQVTSRLKMTEFQEGVLYAAGLIVTMHNKPTIAASIIIEAGLANADISQLDDYDKSQLKKLNGEKGINFRGV